MSAQTTEALVCRYDRGGSEGGAIFYGVRLPDGYFVDCGYNYGAEKRAEDLAAAVNLAGRGAPNELPP